MDWKNEMGTAMKPGKVGESIYKRSVLKLIQTKRREVLHRASVGEEYAALAPMPEQNMVISSYPITLDTADMGSRGVYTAMNHIAATGAEPVGVLADIILPEETEERSLKLLVRQMEIACESLQVELMGCKAQVSAAVNWPLLSITGVGQKKNTLPKQQIKPGMDILMTKYAGLQGTVILANEKEEALLKKFSLPFIEGAKRFDKWLSALPEAAIASKSGAAAMQAVSQGGIFAALWEFAQRDGVGLEIDLKKIPLKQETVEICEYFDLNPYEMLSDGAMLMAAQDGNALIQELEKAGISAAWVGKVTDSNDRLLLNDGEERFLVPAQTDALVYFLGENQNKS